MAKIDLSVFEDRLERTVKRVRERNIIIPTFAQMKNPDLIPAKIKEELRGIGLWDLHPRNLFRISWKNEPAVSGGMFHGRITLRFRPARRACPFDRAGRKNGCQPDHIVGAAFGCPVPRLVTGQF